MSDVPRGLRLLSLAAHELRTPIGVIGGCLSLAQAAGADLARRDRALAQASRNYERAVELLAEMSDLWRLEAGEAVFNRRPLPPEPALRHAVRDVAARLPEGITVDLKVGDLGHARVEVDAVRFERALAAIVLASARQAISGVTLAVRLTTDGSRVQVVAARDRADAASPPADAVRTPVDEFTAGLGLALPIARRVIEADGGTLHAVALPDAFLLVIELPVAS